VATRIRLKRTGAKKQPYYRLVIADARTPRDGRTIEELGVYGPVHNPPLLQVNRERALHWLMEGAQPSDTARSLLSKLGVMAELQQARKAAKGATAQS
jgi:small subunit ribosomal protein S16